MFPICTCANGGPGRKGGLLFLGFPSIKKKIRFGVALALSSLSRSKRGAVCARLAFCSLSVAVPNNTPARAPEMGRKVGRGCCVVAKKKRKRSRSQEEERKKRVGRSERRKKKGVRFFWVSGFLGWWWWLVWAAAGRAKGRTIRHTQAEGRCCATPEKQKGGRGRQEKRRRRKTKTESETKKNAPVPLTPRPPCRSPPRRARGARRAPWPWPSAPCATAASWGP